MGMPIIDFIVSLIPHIEKDTVLEDLRVTEGELQSVAVKSYADAAAFFSKDKFKSRENQKLNDHMNQLLKPGIGGRQPTFIGEFYHRLQLVEKNLATIIRLVNQEMGRDVVTEGISSKKAVLIRIAEKFSYISRKSTDVLNLVYMYEAKEAGADFRQIEMSSAEIQRATLAAENVAKLLDCYGIDPKTFEKELIASPDVILTRSNNTDIEALYIESDIDPLTAQTLVGFTGNPIFHVRMAIAEWQVKRFKENQEKKKALELRLLHLEMMKNTGGTNPNLEQQIAYTQDRVTKLSKSLAEVEEDLGIGR